MWTDILSQNNTASVLTILLTDLLLKVTLVIVAGGGIVSLMRRQSAAAKHLVWTLSLISCLFVPVVMLFLPGWGIERIVNHSPTPDLTAPAVAEPTAIVTEVAQPSPAITAEDSVNQPGDHSPTSTGTTLPASIEPAALISGVNTSGSVALFRVLAVWLAGFVIVLLPLIIGIARVASLRRQSTTVSGRSWVRLVESIRSLRLRRRVALLWSHALDIPLCGGITRPFVIFPGDSTWWTSDRRHLVLLHELAHIRRHDVLVQWVCRLVCAVLWFHPLVWFAARRMKSEQERACDDLVLAAGTTAPSVYAAHLVAIAADCRNNTRQTAAAAALLRRGELESRIRCILQSDRPRQALNAPFRGALFLLMTAAMVSIATAGRVIVRDREGNMVATLPVPTGGAVTIEELMNEEGQTKEREEVQPEDVDLWKQIDTAIEASRSRQLMADRHTPWQIMRLFVPFGREHTVRLDGSLVNALEFVSGGPVYDGDSWFEKTAHGGRAHTFTIPYAFEGHLNQFAAWLSTADLPLEHEFATPDGPITTDDMVQHARATVDETEETTWTLWFLTKYLPQDAEWTNEGGQAWSMERLVRIQVNTDVRRAPSGGRPQLYALTLARNARREQTGELDGVWREADRKIRLYVDAAKLRQNPDGSLPLRVFWTPDLSNSNLNLERRLDNDPFFLERQYRSGRHDDDWHERMRATGSVLAWLSIALPPEELEADWIRDAARYLATELELRRREAIDVGALADGLHGLVAYRQHARMEPAEE